MIELIEVLFNNIKRIIGFPFRILWNMLSVIRAYRVVVYLKSGQSITMYVTSYSITRGKNGGVTNYSFTPIGCVAYINIDEIASVVVFN